MARQYRTMKGKMVDMDQLLEKNQTMPAVGNVRMNARGDELGPGGKIIRKREEVLADYYRDNPQKVPHKQKNVQQPAVESAVESKKEEWIEDAEGNFVKKD